MADDRLDRIEAILASLAESQAAAERRFQESQTLAEQRFQESQTLAEQRFQESQTLAEQRYRESDQRLSRIEALQALTQQQIDSNARSIAAWESRFTEIEEETQEATSRTRADLSGQISTLASVMDGLVRERRADRVEDRQRWEENNHRFTNMLEEARADRQMMDRFMQASTENIQTLFAEISRIWQRLAS